MADLAYGLLESTSWLLNGRNPSINQPTSGKSTSIMIINPFSLLLNLP